MYLFCQSSDASSQEEAKVTVVAERDVGFGCGDGLGAETEATIGGRVVVDVIGEEVKVGAIGDERDGAAICGCDDLKAETGATIGDVDALGTVDEEPSGDEPGGHQRNERRPRSSG